MSNSLSASLKNKKVVVAAKFCKDGMSESERTFLCETGFGCDSFTNGTSIYGKWSDGEQDKINGYMIEKFAKESKTSAKAEVS